MFKTHQTIDAAIAWLLFCFSPDKILFFQIFQKFDEREK